MRAARAHGIPVTFMRGAKVLRWTEVDRLLALGLQAYEDGLCSGCGQPIREGMDPDLLDEWTTLEPQRCGPCTAIAITSDRHKDVDHPTALRYTPGMYEGWPERKAALVAARAERATSDQ